jgi:hypothetical protein
MRFTSVCSEIGICGSSGFFEARLRPWAETDPDPGLVHHVEHVGETAVRLADQVAHRAGFAARFVLALAEAEDRVDGPAEAHLVVDTGQDHVVSLADRTVFVEQEPRNDEEADPLHTGRGTGDLRQYEMHDVVTELV